MLPVSQFSMASPFKQSSSGESRQLSVHAPHADYAARPGKFASRKLYSAKTAVPEANAINTIFDSLSNNNL